MSPLNPRFTIFLFVNFLWKLLPRVILSPKNTTSEFISKFFSDVFQDNKVQLVCGLPMSQPKLLEILYT